MPKKKTIVVTFELDAALAQKLEEVADFEGEESIEDTLRLLIRYRHADMLRFAEEQPAPSGPQPDDEIPF